VDAHYLMRLRERFFKGDGATKTDHEDQMNYRGVKSTEKEKPKLNIALQTSVQIVNAKYLNRVSNKGEQNHVRQRIQGPQVFLEPAFERFLA
jgi:hypothetical protein